MLITHGTNRATAAAPQSSSYAGAGGLICSSSPHPPTLTWPAPSSPVDQILTVRSDEQLTRRSFPYVKTSLTQSMWPSYAAQHAGRAAATSQLRTGGGTVLAPSLLLMQLLMLMLPGSPVGVSMPCTMCFAPPPLHTPTPYACYMVCTPAHKRVTRRCEQPAPILCDRKSFNSRDMLRADIMLRREDSSSGKRGSSERERQSSSSTEHCVIVPVVTRYALI